MADIQEPVAENLHARLATTGITKKLNASSSVSVRTAVRDQRGILRGGSFAEEDLTTFAAFLPSLARDGAIACARTAKKIGGTRCSVGADSTEVGKSAIVRGRSVGEIYSAGGWLATHRAVAGEKGAIARVGSVGERDYAAVAKRAAACGRISEEADKCEPLLVEKPATACRRVIVEFHTATTLTAARTDSVGNTRIARAGAAEELCEAAWSITGLGAAVSDGNIPRGRAICELYRSMFAGDIGRSHKILRDP